MMHLIRLMGWEWFKLRQRWMPWVLLGILILFTQLLVWAGYFTYTNLQATGGQVPLPRQDDVTPGRFFRLVSCNDLREDPQAAVPEGTPPEVIPLLLAQCEQQAGQFEAQLRQQYGAFTLPGSLPGAYNIAVSIGLILIAILTASVIGSEYGLGTLRPMLVRGIGRMPFLAAKLALLLLAVAVALLIVSVATVISSLIAADIAQAPPGGPGEADTWAEAGMALGKAWLALIPYIALTALLVVLTRSAAGAMGISLGYYLMEGILVVLLTALIAGFDRVADYLLIGNINAFIEGNIGPPDAAIEVTTGHAAIVLAAYTVAFVVPALAIFKRRDIAGPSGG
jgi:ABC-type transport system involved in multi-copper enzyme maturation permease subunit